jgi:hypothetical protein
LQVCKRVCSDPDVAGVLGRSRFRQRDSMLPGRCQKPPLVASSADSGGALCRTFCGSLQNYCCRPRLNFSRGLRVRTSLGGALATAMPTRHETQSLWRSDANSSTPHVVIEGYTRRTPTSTAIQSLPTSGRHSRSIPPLKIGFVALNGSALNYRVLTHCVYVVPCTLFRAHCFGLCHLPRPLTYTGTQLDPLS